MPVPEYKGNIYKDKLKLRIKILIYCLIVTYGKDNGASLISFPTLGKKSFENQREIFSQFFRFLLLLKMFNAN